MTKYFLYLELLDSSINAFLNKTARCAGNKKQSSPVHVTVRGPYKNPIKKETFEKCQSDMKGDIIEISGVGRFSNDGEEVVYFRVDSTNLRKTWKKMDFTIAQYGFNPHISIYRGNDAQWADELFQFLQKINIKILTSQFKLIEVTSKQQELEANQSPEDASIDIKGNRLLSRLINPDSKLIGAGSNQIDLNFFANLTRLNSKFHSLSGKNSITK